MLQNTYDILHLFSKYNKYKDRKRGDTITTHMTRVD
jgi:hypothetical protein